MQKTTFAKALIAFEQDYADWSKYGTGNYIKSLLEARFASPVRLVLESAHLLCFYFDFSRDIENRYVTHCLIFLLRSEKGIGQEELQNIIKTISLTMVREGCTDEAHLAFFSGFSNFHEQMIADAFDNIISRDFSSFANEFRGRGDIIRKLNKRKLDLSISPYRYLGPCRPEIFVGREKIIRQILHGDYGGHIITGSRRIGKSSLLLKMHDMVRKDESLGLDSYYIDCSNVDSFSSLALLILKKVSPRFVYSGKTKLFTFDDILKRASALKGKKLLLLLDETDEFLEKVKDRDEGKTFYNALQIAANGKENLKMVISGFRKVTAMLDDSTHPFYNLFKGEILPLLTENEVRKLVTTPLFKMGFDFENPEELVRKVYTYTGGYPSAVQLLASELFDIREDTTITMDSLERAIRSRTVSNFTFDTFMENTLPLERLLSILLVEKETFREEDAHECIRQRRLGLENSHTKVHKALRNLYQSNILEQHNDIYRFLFPLLPQLIGHRMSSEPIIADLISEVQRG